MQSQYAISDHDFLRAYNFDAEEIDREIRNARNSGQTVFSVMLKSNRATWLDYLFLCVEQCKSGVVELDADDPFPEFDLLLEMNNAAETNLFAVGVRADPARRVLIMGPSRLAGSALHESFHAYLKASNYRVIGYLADSEKRLLQTVRANHSQSGSEFLLEGQKIELHDLFDSIAKAAIKEDASDIHIAIVGGKTEIAFRINGSMTIQNAWAMTQDEGLSMIRSVYNVITAGTKGDYIQDQLQDGVIEREYERGRVRFRFSSLPIEPRPGSDVTLRIIHIGATAKIRTAQQLGYSEQQSHQLDRMFARSSGMILFNGITGSGKSTSMANFLMRYCKQRPDRKVRTVEDPVEYIIPGAKQTATTGQFNLVLKQLMRSDPDAIMVGEVRDHETAELILHAVRSGHLSVSTLHADGCLVAYDRLAGMGVKRQDLASIGLVIGMVFQRLVKVTCTHCRLSAREAVANPSDSDRGLVDRLLIYLDHHDGHRDALDGMFWQNPSGCDRCRHTGYSARTICAEVFVPTPELSPIIASGDSLALNKAWRAQIDRKNPMSTNGRSAFEHALFKMRAGICSPQAVEDEFDGLDSTIYLTDHIIKADV